MYICIYIFFAHFSYNLVPEPNFINKALVDSIQYMLYEIQLLIRMIGLYILLIF